MQKFRGHLYLRRFSVYCLLQLESELKQFFLVPEINQSNSGHTGGTDGGSGIEQNLRESGRGAFPDTIVSLLMHL